MKFFTYDSNISHLKTLAAMGTLDGVFIDNLTPTTVSWPNNVSILEALKMLPDCRNITIVASLDDDDLKCSREELTIRVGDLKRIVGNNLCLTVPMSYSGLSTCHTLAKKSEVVNVLNCHSVSQVLLAAAAGAGFVSISTDFCDMHGINVIDLVADIRGALDNYEELSTKIMVVAVHNGAQLAEFAKMGVDTVVISHDALQRILKPDTVA